MLMRRRSRVGVQAPVAMKVGEAPTAIAPPERKAQEFPAFVARSWDDANVAGASEVHWHVTTGQRRAFPPVQPVLLTYCWLGLG